MARHVNRNRLFGRVLPILGLAAFMSACGQSATQSVLLYGPQFCYRTLADADCHDAAVPGAESRRLGSYEAPHGILQMDSLW